MKKLFSSILACFVFFTAFTSFTPEAAHARSDQWVNGYVKKNGTVVQPYRRTNPYHGKPGTKPRDEDVWKHERRRGIARP